jgi:hypothetical protein
LLHAGVRDRDDIALPLDRLQLTTAAAVWDIVAIRVRAARIAE